MRKIYFAMVFVLGVISFAAISLAVSSQLGHDQAGRSSADASAEPFAVVGLTDDQDLVAFPSDKPQEVTSIGRIIGLQGDTRLIGIDCRVSENTAYGVGDRGGVYRISLRDATTTKVSQLSVALQGNDFDVDFNPAAHRLRIISDSGQNLRHNVDDPAGTPAIGVTVADAALSMGPNTAPAVGVTGAAYYNNDLDPDTATTLFVLDATRDQIAIQSPADAGSLAATGKLGVDANRDSGFDIHYNAGGGTSNARGLAALQVDGKYGLYEVDLLTGRADFVGSFPAEHQVTDITAGFRRDEIDGIL
jgi:hypothetical protein